MTIKSEMIKTAGIAKGMLGSSVDLVLEYVKSQQNPDGGFRGRSANSDLYYTVFGKNILSALNTKPSYPIENYIPSVNTNLDFDFINLCSFINLITSPDKVEAVPSEKIACFQNLLESYRSQDGGYSANKNSPHGSVYGCFLAFSAYENLGMVMPQKERILNCLERLLAADGGYSNEPNQKEGTTTSTAAAIVLMKKLNIVVPEKTIDWLLMRIHKSGGFLATPSTAIPDLLSTATALFALKSIDYSLGNLKDSCLDFLDSVWDGNGAFRGHWFDEQTDVEYTFYGLLSIGCLEG